MREIPILFSPAMVREILAGRKTQTRRGNGLDAINEAPSEWEFDRWQTYPGGEKRAVFVHRDGEPTGVRCPYGSPGDTLWVREAWAALIPGSYEDSPRPQRSDHLLYAADERPIADVAVRGHRWRPSIHMPRWASRLSLRVESVRVERAQAISDDDVQREGVSEESVRALWDAATRARQGECGPDVRIVGVEWRELWRLAWTLLYGAASWEADPWLWCVGFSPVAGERAGRAA